MLCEDYRRTTFSAAGVGKLGRRIVIAITASTVFCLRALMKAAKFLGKITCVASGGSYNVAQGRQARYGRRSAMRDDVVTDEMERINNEVEQHLKSKSDHYYRRFMSDVVGLILHHEEDMLQVECKRIWARDVENAVEDAIRDVTGDYESDMVFTLVERQKS